MAFNDCLLTLVQAGELSKVEAADLSKRYDERYAQARLSLPDGAAAKTARDKLATELRMQAVETRRRAILANGVRANLKTYLQGYRGLNGKADIFEAALNKLEHYGLGGTTAVAGRVKAIVSLAHGEMADLLTAFRRSKLTGGRFNRPQALAIVKERFGEASGDEAARAMSDSVENVFETLRQRHVAAGGAIAKLDRFGLPQSHDATTMLSGGRSVMTVAAGLNPLSRPAIGAMRDRWLTFIKPLLDRPRMLDPLTKEVMSDARLDQALRHVWASVATDGLNDLTPSLTRHGQGMIASQRSDHRFLTFKDAEAWQAYAQEYGNPDPIAVIFDHVNGMARDIAAMEELGPNPSAMIEWLKQVVSAEAAKQLDGKPSLYNPGKLSILQLRDRLPFLPNRIDSVWQGLRGGTTVSSRMAAGVSNVRNVLTSAQLGSAAVLAAATDPFIDMMARRLTGLPMLKSLGIITQTFATSTREEAVHAGILLDDFLHMTEESARFAGMIAGSEWSKWLVDRTLNLSALEPLTQARKHVFALDTMRAFAKQSDKALADVDPVIRRWMEGYGITPANWDVIRKTPLHRTDPEAAGVIRPIDVAAQPGGTEAAERMLMLIQGQTERAVPSGTVRARTALVPGTVHRGTVYGELLSSMLQYKQFGLSMFTLQLQALQMELGTSLGRGLTYGAGLTILTTIGGALGLQLRQIINGKDPEPMTDPRFVAQAIATGGGFGIFGDFLMMDQTRYGGSFAETVGGPMAALISDSLRLGPGNVQKTMLRYFGGDQSQHAGRDLVNYAGRYTPVVGTLWYAREAYKRLILDQLQYAIDPDAHKHFRAQEMQAAKQTGQGFWWRPGMPGPSRAPDLGNALGQEP